ncbi:MAG TPA: phosphoribosyltransferase family protein [Gemmataceae bacterium]|nr:phosphoribosyltransferase family protein [Gemmataceae bacterium]
MDKHQLGGFRLARNAATGDLLLLVSGPTLYKAVLGRAFPALYFSRTFEDRFGQFTWGTYIRGAGAAEEKALGEFCTLLQAAVYIDDDLDESFALSFHTQTSPAGGYERTAIGRLVYEAKPYDRIRHPGDRQRAAELAGLLVRFVQQQPTYRAADLLIPVPPSNQNKDYDLPTLLAEAIGKQTGIAATPAALRKTRNTRPMKDCRTVQEKIDNLKGAFTADPALVKGKKVILVDDIYQTGFSINEVCRVLRGQGVALVLGLVATKTAHDLSEDNNP